MGTGKPQLKALGVDANPEKLPAIWDREGGPGQSLRKNGRTGPYQDNTI